MEEKSRRKYGESSEASFSGIKIISHQGLVGRVISDDGEILTIFFGDRTMRFYKKDFKVYQAPDFVWGDRVLIINKNIEGYIVHFTWHFNKNEYFYFIETDGKKLKKRYFAEDLKRI